MKITEWAETVKKDIKCGIPQCSVLRSLLFLLYVSDLPNHSNVLVTIMFANNTNFVFEYSNINTLFKTVNDILNKAGSNKLSLSVGKTKFSLLYKSGKIIDHPFSSSNVKNKQSQYQKSHYDEIFRCLIWSNLLRKEHIKYLESEIAKNIELMYRAISFLDKESLLELHYSCIHFCLNNASLPWGNTYRANLKKLRSQQNYTIWMVHNKRKLNIKNFLNQQRYWIYINLFSIYILFIY